MLRKEVIQRRQKEWARRSDLQFNESGYLSTYENNLFKPLSPTALTAFKSGKGSELESKMLALHSSSALAVNFFDTWRDTGDLSVLTTALGIRELRGCWHATFEKEFRTCLKGTPPTLDVVLESIDEPVIVAIESKFTEWLGRKSSIRAFSQSYFPHSSAAGLWCDQNLPRCQVLAERIQTGDFVFDTLDAAQLLKHSLGLASNSGGRPFYLCYVYFDDEPDSGESRQHHSEISRFEEYVGAEIGFRAISYQSIFSKIPCVSFGSMDRWAYLKDRYF